MTCLGVSFAEPADQPRDDSTVAKILAALAVLLPALHAARADAIQINDVQVGENGLIYANDRLVGGQYIIRCTGSVPLN